MRAGHLIRTTLVLVAVATAVTACGRRPSQLETPYEASKRLRKEAEQNKEPVPPARPRPETDKPFIAVSMWSITAACSRRGLKRITSASFTTRTLWPGGQ